MSGNSSGGNARDQRQRGNAAQLLEKYKSLARDSQLAGDRVQTEYWLQFADHYFRVLGESRAKYDEQRRARGESVDDDYDDDGEGYDGDDDGDEPSQQPQQQPRQQQHEQPRRQQEGDRYERPDRQQQDRQQQDRQQQDRQQQDRPERQDRQQQQQPRNDRYERQDRPERQAERQERPERAERPERQAERQERPPIQQQPRAERVERAPRADAADRPDRAPRADRPRIRRDREVESDGGGERIAFDVIPPAIGASTAPEVPANDVAEEAPAPRRRVRRARPEGEADVAPAA